MLTLRDPYTCPKGHTQTTRTHTRRRKNGVVYRRHRCEVCGSRWRSYQTVLNPSHIRLAPR